MESTLQKPALSAQAERSVVITAPKGSGIYWVAIALFCLQMSFTAYAELRLPQVAPL